MMTEAMGTGWLPRSGAWVSRLSPSGVVFRLQINSTGQRGSEIPPLTPSQRRVLFLGDSFTYGGAVPEDSTFVFQVGVHLRRAGRQVIAINGGVPGYSTYQELAYQRYVAGELRPDVVVLAFFNGNDIRDNMVHTRNGEILSPALVGDFRATRKPAIRSLDLVPDPLSGADIPLASGMALSTIQRSSMLGRLLIGRLNLLLARQQADLRYLDPKSLYHYYEIGLFQGRTDPTFVEAKKLTLTCLRRLAQQVREDNAELLVVAIPSRNQVDPKAWSQNLGELGVELEALGTLNMDAPGQVIRELCGSLGVPFVDLTQTFREHPDPASLFLVTHLSTMGHTFMAEHLGAFVEAHSKRLDDPAIPRLHAAADALYVGNARLAIRLLAGFADSLGSRLDVLRLLGEAQLSGGFATESVASFRKALSFDPASAKLRSQLGEALMATGDTVSAIASYQKAFELRPANWTYQARLSDLRAQADRSEAAAHHTELAERIAWKDRHSRRAWGEEHLLRGALYLQQRRVSLAEIEFRYATPFRREPDEVAHLAYWLGTVFQASGRLDSAHAYFSRIGEGSEFYTEARAALNRMSRRPSTQERTPSPVK
ncbi:MAG: hypothetical protein VX733_04245 [Candidatus Latescibacterota bacterium]|nr:hypothetical protein [Candidatus Latescibacterota bacterium]